MQGNENHPSILYEFNFLINCIAFYVRCFERIEAEFNDDFAVEEVRSDNGIENENVRRRECENSNTQADDINEKKNDNNTNEPIEIVDIEANIDGAHGSGNEGESSNLQSTDRYDQQLRDFVSSTFIKSFALNRLNTSSTDNPMIIINDVKGLSTSMTASNETQIFGNHHSQHSEGMPFNALKNDVDNKIYNESIESIAVQQEITITTTTTTTRTETYSAIENNCSTKRNTKRNRESIACKRKRLHSLDNRHVKPGNFVTLSMH